MDKNKYIIGAICLVAGFAISFYVTRKYNRENTATASTGSSTTTGAGGQQAMMGQVQQILEKAKANPRDFEAQVQAAQVFARIERTSEAVDFLEKAYEASPADFAKLDGAFEFAGGFYLSQKQYDKAEAWYTRATKAAPQTADLYVMLGETFVQREPPQPDKAIDYIQQALKIDPKSGHALGHLVEAYAIKKDARLAEESLNRLKETDPANDRLSSLQTMVADVKAGKPVAIPKE